MYDTILVPTDGSDGSEAAARHGVSLAAAFDCDVHFLSVVDTSSGDLSDATPEGADNGGAAEQHAVNAIEAVEPLATERSIASRTTIECGVPHESILSYAAEHDIDLISMGTHGRTGLDRMLLGSVTERVVRTSDVPVLVSQLGSADRSDYSRILIPTDGSEAAATALPHGIAIADRYDAEIHAISIVDTNALTTPYPMRRSDVRVALKEDCEQAVEQVREQCENRGIDVVTTVIEGTPHQALQEYTTENDIELVAMGTHGRTGLERYLIGSVASRVLRTSEVPVLTTQ